MHGIRFLSNMGICPFVWNEAVIISLHQFRKNARREQCGIYKIDHEILFDFDETLSGKPRTFDENMEFVSQIYLYYLDEILHDRDRESVAKTCKAAILDTLKGACALQTAMIFTTRYDEDPRAFAENSVQYRSSTELSDDDNGKVCWMVIQY